MQQLSGGQEESAPPRVKEEAEDPLAFHIKEEQEEADVTKSYSPSTGKYSTPLECISPAVVINLAEPNWRFCSRRRPAGATLPSAPAGAGGSTALPHKRGRGGAAATLRERGRGGVAAACHRDEE